MQALCYGGTRNLGDAIQSIALARLLAEPPRWVGRDAGPHDPEELLIVNGWLGPKTVLRGANCLFAGVHVASPHVLPWLRASRFPIGARDPATAELLRAADIPCEMIGCATLTLPRHDGPRAGTYAADADRPGARRTEHGRDGSWAWQMEEAQWLLDGYRQASLVVTSRLHAALPCLAFGTPVVIHPPDDERRIPSRFTLLAALGVRAGAAQTADTGEMAARFQSFLRKILPAPSRSQTAGE